MNTTTTTRLVTEGNIEYFRQLVSSIDWSELSHSTDPNVLYDLFLNTIIEVNVRASPAVTIKKSKKARMPCITRDILQRIKARNERFNKFILCRDLSILKEFKIVRNELGSDIKKSRIRYYTGKFADIFFDPQKTWRTVKGLLRGTQNIIPTEMRVGEQTLSGKALADEFNRHFLTFGASPLSTSEDFEKYIKHNIQHTMFLYPTSPTEIVSLIGSLKNNCSCGFDGIKAAPIKAVSNLICDVVCHLTNLVLSSGIFPEKMKTARISVLHKGGAVDSVSNYRPI